MINHNPIGKEVSEWLTRGSDYHLLEHEKSLQNVLPLKQINTKETEEQREKRRIDFTNYLIKVKKQLKKDE